jgi:hypothetical protein
VKHSPDAYHNINLFSYERDLMNIGGTIVPVIKGRFQSMGVVMSDGHERYFHGNRSSYDADRMARAFLRYQRHKTPAFFTIDRKHKKLIGSYGPIGMSFIEDEIIEAIIEGCDF